MKPLPLFLAAALCPSLGFAAPQIDIVRSESDKGFALPPVPPPATNDAATDAKFSLVDGAKDPNSPDLAVLHDGRVPASPDEPATNFFLQSGTPGGRIVIDLEKLTTVRSVHTYSWHPAARAAQVYRLYGATGDERKFSTTPQGRTNPRNAGWKPIAKVDTTSKGRGGQVAVAISDGAALGEFRYLLFDIDPTDPGNSQSHTFFSEIDVLDASGPPPTAIPAKIVATFPSSDGKFEYIVDATIAPDLAPWVKSELMPVVEEWYPKLVAMLPSDGYSAPTTVRLEFRDDMGGTPAYAAGDKLSMSAPWFRTQLEGEAKGCVIHELVHIVQNYWSARRTNPRATRTPGWVTEGIPDYIRWFIYEPQVNGANITKRNFANASYDSSYRVSANFLDWVVRTHDENFISKLNTAAREGRYSDKIWTDATGKTPAELGADWKAAHAKRLGL